MAKQQKKTIKEKRKIIRETKYMVYTKCCEYGVPLEIDENDYMPGCREREEVICPKCKKVATTVRTSGFPTARLVSEDVIKAVMKEFDM